jgi:hypothetical protein
MQTLVARGSDRCRVRNEQDDGTKLISQPPKLEVREQRQVSMSKLPFEPSVGIEDPEEQERSGSNERAECHGQPGVPRHAKRRPSAPSEHEDRRDQKHGLDVGEHRQTHEEGG